MKGIVTKILIILNPFRIEIMESEVMEMATETVIKEEDKVVIIIPIIIITIIIEEEITAMTVDIADLAPEWW